MAKSDKLSRREKEIRLIKKNYVKLTVKRGTLSKKPRSNFGKSNNFIG